MYTGSIKSISKGVNLNDNVPFLDVTLEISNGEEVVDYRRFSYSIATTAEEIKTDLKKFITTYNQEAESREANKATEELDRQADATIAELAGENL